MRISDDREGAAIGAVSDSTVAAMRQTKNIDADFEEFGHFLERQEGKILYEENLK
jgi:hypothetical protein